MTESLVRVRVKDPTSDRQQPDVQHQGPAAPGAEPPPGRGGGLRRRRRGPEAVFRWCTTGAGITVLVIIVAIAVFLIIEAVPALRANQANFLTYRRWFPNDATTPKFGIAALAAGTLLTSGIALLAAVPVAVGIALFLSHYAPWRLAAGLGFVIDLLAAVPSVIFGLWGRDYLVGPVGELSGWLHHHLGWIPLFGRGPYGNSILLGSLVLAIMLLPIITALSRDVFVQAPRAGQEAALALGATRWEVVRTAVLPVAGPGIAAAVLLGLGRALGETIALAMTLGATFGLSANIIQVGGNSIAGNIANAFAEANPTGRGALIASGLVLFAITLVVNVVARAIIHRRSEYSGSRT